VNETTAFHPSFIGLFPLFSSVSDDSHCFQGGLPMKLQPQRIR
jgi:hypothetical protein